MLSEEAQPEARHCFSFFACKKSHFLLFYLAKKDKNDYNYHHYETVIIQEITGLEAVEI